MAYVIVKEECISCGACETECPNGAVIEDGDCFVIKAEDCSDCGACADICPQECILQQE